MDKAADTEAKSQAKTAGWMRIHSGTVNYTRVEEAAINREAEAPIQTSVISFTIPKTPSSLSSQEVLARWGNWPSRKVQGHSLEIMPRTPLFYLPRGEIPGFPVTVAWIWRPKNRRRGVLAARRAPTTEPSPANPGCVM